MARSNQNPATQHEARLSIAIMGPDRKRCIAATSALSLCGNVQVREFTTNTPSLDDIRQLREGAFDGVLIDLDSDPEVALALVEQLCTGSNLIVMVFSANADPDLMLRSMRAGAREFFILPFKNDAIAKALRWISAQHQPAPVAKKAAGRLHVFFGSKGGVGVTTLACNFAVALADESGQNTLLIDLNLLMGDAALNLGIQPQHSIVDALQNSANLDAKLLSTFFAHHSSGLSVLAAPAEMGQVRASSEAIGKLLAAARQLFDNVVVDAGKKIDLRELHLFDESATAYLVTQVGIPELRNANRLISQFSADFSPKLEIVINRHQSRFLGFTDEHLTKALTKPIAWKIPNDFKAVKQMQSNAVPIVNQDSSIATAIRQMARAASGTSESRNGKIVGSLSSGGFRLPWKSAAPRLNPENVSADFHPAPRSAQSSPEPMPR